jgi:hypothetical protein
MWMLRKRKYIVNQKNYLSTYSVVRQGLLFETKFFTVSLEVEPQHLNILYIKHFF